jgi:hypothetical protein
MVTGEGYLLMMIKIIQTLREANLVQTTSQAVLSALSIVTLIIIRTSGIILLFIKITIVSKEE